MLRFTLAPAVAAIALAAFMPGQAGAQSYPDSRYAAATTQNGWNRDQFWQGAPAGSRQRIDWLQRRINRGRRRRPVRGLFAGRRRLPGSLR